MTIEFLSLLKNFKDQFHQEFAFLSFSILGIIFFYRKKNVFLFFVLILFLFTVHCNYSPGFKSEVYYSGGSLTRIWPLVQKAPLKDYSEISARNQLLYTAMIIAR